MRNHRKGKPRRSAELQAHFDRVGRLPCCVSGYRPATLHHCHGGSLRDMGIHKGFNQKTTDWLVIPLAPMFHCDGGDYAIDGPAGVRGWEVQFGTQVKHLDDVSRALGYNVWLRAGIDRPLEGLC